MILEKLQLEVAEQLAAWAKGEGLEKPAPLVLVTPPPHVKADVSLPWPLATGKALKRKPLDVAAKAAEVVGAQGVVEAAEPIPPGFVNVRLALPSLCANLLSLVKEPQLYGRAAALTARKVLIEFVSANPTGPVHLASGRAATLGDSLVRILKRRGHEAASEFYVNDAGRQVTLLGESVLARYKQAQGEEVEIPEGGYQGDYIKDLAAAVPAEASSWEATDFGKFAVGKMLEQHKADMENFGVLFDRWYLESELHASKALDSTLAELKKLGHVKEHEDAIWLDTSSGEDDKDRVLIRSDGRPTYLLADIAYHRDKISRGWTELIDIWGADHHGYVARMSDAITALGHKKGTFRVIIHQLVRLFRGKEAVKMSKRAGQFLTLRSLVEEVGLDACRFFFARHTPNAHMNFDIELAKKKTQENPVYYVQYVHARIASIFRTAAEQGITTSFDNAAVLGRLTHDSERALLVKMAWFPHVLEACEKERSPHPLANYLMELAGLYHPFYEQCHVLEPKDAELTQARLTLCEGVRALIAEGLGLLGVSAPEKM